MTAKKKQGPRVEGGSREARRAAAMILEVLAGARTPTEAAEGLGISVPSYYNREVRALGGFVEACEPTQKGYRKTPEARIAQLEDEIAKLERDCVRFQALARASQRAIGIRKPSRPKPDPKGGKKRRKKPSVRALKAAKRLQSTEETSVTEPIGLGEIPSDRSAKREERSA